MSSVSRDPGGTGDENEGKRARPRKDGDRRHGTSGKPAAGFSAGAESSSSGIEESQRQHHDGPVYRGRKRKRDRNKRRCAARAKMPSETEIQQLVKVYLDMKMPDGQVREVLAAIDTQSNVTFVNERASVYRPWDPASVPRFSLRKWSITRMRVIGVHACV